MSDISLVTPNINDDMISTSIKQKNSNIDHSSPSSKKIRLDENDHYESGPVQSSSVEKIVEPDPVLPMSPQSEQTASTSSSSGCSEWTNFLKDSRIPVPYSDLQNPRQLLNHMGIDTQKLPSSLDDFDICRLVYQLMATSGSTSNLPNPMLSDMFLIQREKLQEYNTIEQCVELINKSQNIIVLTGAGCSVSCGIPDFRSRDGVYARLRVDFPDLPDPQAMFDIYYFDHDPRPFFKFAKEIYPGQFKPSLSHLFIKKLEDNKKLLRNYTQNIDTLEMTAEIKKVIQCHGSFATATCTTCKYQVDADHIRDKIFRQEIPYCEKCKLNDTIDEQTASVKNIEEKKTNEQSLNESESTEECEKRAEENLVYKKNNSAGILKPDIVFFGEGLPELYHKSIADDKTKCDLLIVIGSSLKVKPVANIPHLLPDKVPQILINRESLKHLNFDIELLGDCDVIVNELLLRLDEKSKLESIENESTWSDICRSNQLLKQIADEDAENLLFSNRSDDSDSTDSSPDTSTVIVRDKDKLAKEDQNSKELVNSKPEDINLTKKYTKDYLKESSFLYLKPNMYVFHGAEIQLKHARRKLKKLKKKNDLIGDENNQEKDSLSDVEDSDDDSSNITDESDSDDDDDEEEEEEDDDDDDIENEELKSGIKPNHETGENTYLEVNHDVLENENSIADNGLNDFDKRNLLEIFNEETFDDEDDDEDFTPENKT